MVHSPKLHRKKSVKICVLDTKLTKETNEAVIFYQKCTIYKELWETVKVQFMCKLNWKPWFHFDSGLFVLRLEQEGLDFILPNNIFDPMERLE